MCCDFFVFFFDSCFLKLRNALENERTVKLVFIFKCKRPSLWIKNYIMYANLNIQIYPLKNKFYFIHKFYSLLIKINLKLTIFTWFWILKCWNHWLFTINYSLVSLVKKKTRLLFCNKIIFLLLKVINLNNKSNLNKFLFEFKKSDFYLKKNHDFFQPCS